MSLRLIGPNLWCGVVLLLWGLLAGAADDRLRADQPGADRSSHDAGLLIIPDSINKRLMTFDPVSGDLTNADFIALDEVATGTAIHALRGPQGTILVSDQTNNVVHEYTLAGNYLGVLAPAGGANTSIMENIRGMSISPQGDLLVTSAAGTNANAIVRFSASGSHLGNFISAGSGGLNGPFSLLRRTGVDWLVSSIGNDRILSFSSNGSEPLGIFAPVNNFPQQMARRHNGHVLVANFAGQPGIHEFTPDGVPVRVLAPEGLSGYRGVFELLNGNILASTSGGVFEIDNQGQLVATKYGGGARFIQPVPPTGIRLRITVGEQPDPQDVNLYENFCPHGSEYRVQPGETVRWCYEVTNNTTTTLSRHDLASDVHGAILDELPVNLAPGASVYIFQASIVNEETLESATWTAYNPGPLDVQAHTASASVLLLGPTIFQDRFEIQD
jgi:hypothetical protein